MKVLKINVLRGPNFWSNYHKKLIVMKLDLENFEDLPTNKLPDFVNKLTTLLPSLSEHTCSYKEANGFIKRMQEGTWLGHVIEHVALELQTLAGMRCSYGRTRSSGKQGIYYVVFAYEYEKAGTFAAKAAFKIVFALANNKNYTKLTSVIDKLKLLMNGEKIGPSTQSILDEAAKRKIPSTYIDGSIFMLGNGQYQKLIWAAMSSTTSLVGGDIASDKVLTKNILASQYIPVPKGEVIEKVNDLYQTVKRLKFPLVIKPHNANHGRGVTTNINSMAEARAAFVTAKKISKKVIIEKFYAGDDYRFLVINYKVEAVAKRTPPVITGNGLNTIEELIVEENAHPKRGLGHSNHLTRISVEKVTLSILEKFGYTLTTILPAKQTLALKNVANLSAGGTATNVTDDVHPENIFLAERIARLLNLDICGIDMIAQDIKKKMDHTNGAIIEVNAGPGLRMHLSPTEGRSRNVAKAIVDMLYPSQKPFSIPITAVTGTNGKTTVVRLLAHIAQHAGHSVGFTTTEGIYLNSTQIYKGDCSGPDSARVILRDPGINFAVLETARGGILRSGLGFDNCHMSIITNISEDHIGQEEVDTIQDLQRAKSVVARSTYDYGYCILNADDDLVYELREEIISKYALFSMNDNNPRINEHCKNGGIAIYLKNNCMYINDGGIIKVISRVSEIPLTFAGTAECMIQNVLCVTLAAILHNYSVETIITALREFPVTSTTLPGRMNIFKFPSFKLMIDYAHNEAAFQQLKKFMLNTISPRKVGIIVATGDRRDEDIRKIGFYSAEIFDQIIIRHDKNGRGRTNEELSGLLLEGIDRAGKNLEVHIISNEFKALDFVINNVKDDDFIVLFPDDVLTSIDYVNARHSEFANTVLA